MAPAVLGDGEDPVISPAGDRVAFVKGGQIWTAPLDGLAPAKPLFSARGSNSDPRWAPDGSRLAFVSGREGTRGLYISDIANGTGERPLAPSPGEESSPAWSPDGSCLAFVSDRDGNREIYVVGADGSAPRRLTDHLGADHDPRWRPAD